jgi:hypothetical protein
VIRKVNRATAAKALSRCVRALLLHAQDLASLIHDWAAVMGRSLIRHMQGRNQPRKNTRYKPHPSQAYKRAACVRDVTSTDQDSCRRTVRMIDVDHPMVLGVFLKTWSVTRRLYFCWTRLASVTRFSGWRCW